MRERKENVVVSVVMPAYNEEKCIMTCFHNVAKALEGFGRPFEIILEEDGSTDRTPEMMDELAENHAYTKVLHFPARMGKGFGIRRCLDIAQGECIVLLDSDMEYPPEKIPEFVEKTDEYDVVVGFRSVWVNEKGGPTRLVRMLLSYMYSFLIGRLFAVDLRDYQSGFKAFRREVIEAILPLTSTGFEIDSEILIKARRKGFRVGFISIAYTFKGNSSVNVFTDPIRMFLSLVGWKLDYGTRSASLDIFRTGKSAPTTELPQLERAVPDAKVHDKSEARS